MLIRAKIKYFFTEKSNKRLGNLLESLLDSLAFSFVARLIEQSEHVLLVCFHTRLVEWVDTKNESADAASLLEEVDELAEVVLIELVDGDADVWHATIHVSELSAKFCHVVHFVDTLACEEVQTVEVFFVGWNSECVVWSIHRDNRFEDGTLTVLNPLTHGMEVGGEIHCCWEDALLVLTFGLAIELLPPFVHVVELRLEVHEDFNLLAFCIESVADGCVLSTWVLLEWHVGVSTEKRPPTLSGMTKV